MSTACIVYCIPNFTTHFTTLRHYREYFSVVNCLYALLNLLHALLHTFIIIFQKNQIKLPTKWLSMARVRERKRVKDSQSTAQPLPVK